MGTTLQLGAAAQALCWNGLRMQDKAYHHSEQVLVSETVKASPPSKDWKFGRGDAVIVNTDCQEKWPHSGLQGHTVAHLHMIICVVPFNKDAPPPGTNQFLAYVQRFDVVPQKNPTTGVRGLFPEPTSSLYQLKRARRADNSILGDIVPLERLRAPVEITPRFGKKADSLRLDLCSATGLPEHYIALHRSLQKQSGLLQTTTNTTGKIRYPRNVLFQSYSTFPCPPLPSHSAGTITADSWTAVGGSNSRELKCPNCPKQFKKGASQKNLRDHMASNACKGKSWSGLCQMLGVAPQHHTLLSRYLLWLRRNWLARSTAREYHLRGIPQHFGKPSPSISIVLTQNTQQDIIYYSWNILPLLEPVRKTATEQFCPQTALAPSVLICILTFQSSRSELAARLTSCKGGNGKGWSQHSQTKEFVRNLNLEGSVESMHKRLKEYIDLLQFIGQHSHEIPVLYRLLANAVVNNWSANVILEHCKLAVEGKYTAQNYTLYEIYLAILIYGLGGAGALYTMNHSIFALPSCNTIQPYRSQAKLMPSVNGVWVAEISSNISALFGPWASRETNTETAKPTIYGHTLSFGEVATERKIDYMHKPMTWVAFGTNTKTVEAAMAAVWEGKVHISHETSVGAISHLSETGYGAWPAFMGPSCKTGDWKDCLQMMEIVLEAWKCLVYREQLHGPILSVASDGDPKCCLALFMMCMHTKIIEGNPLYPFICKLPGLNRRVGKDNLTMDPDFKHEVKHHDWSETSLHALLDPADGQNVSGAIKLMLCIIELTSLDKGDFDPNEALEFEALCLLAEFLNAWLQPYINMDLSLSEQIESLVMCSHLCAGLYIQNGASFMSNQLFTHIEASVKNAVLMVAKTRAINGELKVFICLLGDDVLEALFGVAELCDCFMSVMNLDWICKQYPEFERQPRWLNMSRMHHVDHLRPWHFQRELHAGSCDLPVIWKSAVHKVEAILAKYGLRMGVSFAIRFKQPETDLLHPFGGKYPALSSKVDRSVVDSLSTPTTDSMVDPGSFNTSHLIPTTEFDRMFSEIKSSDTPACHSLFVDIDDNGRQGHKKTIVCTFFDMTHDIHTSRDRLQCVRCFTYGGKTWTQENGEGNQTLSASTHFQLGNLFMTLICYNNTHLVLAIVKCTLIKKGPTGSKASSMSAVPRAELDLPDSVYTISGQAHELLALDSEVPCDREKMWSFSDKDLSVAWSCLWERLLADKTLHNKFLVFTGISDGVFPYTTVPPPELMLLDSPAIYYSKPIAGTVVKETHFNRSTCHVCGIVVKDTNHQHHVGEHILKSICGVEDPSVKLLLGNSSPHTRAETFQSNVPSTATSVTGSITSSSISRRGTLNGDKILSQSFLSTIQISSAEQEALGVPQGDIIDIPAAAPPNPPCFPPRIQGHKRAASSPPSSPSHGTNKENEGVAASNSDIDLCMVHASKVRKLIH
ncbi:hypothetical protein B0H10DRAFT_1969186 [Mycena sp. CBHHK59/15]|nr:hypothetical protein B0H10DRAFT_1969186 [Mycena sp. CBHHK59/15]